MQFTNQIVYKNCRNKMSSTIILLISMVIIYFSMISGLFINVCLINSLDNMENRLGADIMVVPYEACTKQEFDDLIIQGRPGEFYMSKDIQNNILKREGIEEICTQLYFSKLKLEGYEKSVEVIGIDKDKDFLLNSWLKNKELSKLKINQVIVGYKLNNLVGKKIEICGTELMVVDSLEKTDGYMDLVVYTDMGTIEQIILNGSNQQTVQFRSILPSRVTSTMLINVKEDYLVEQVLDDINIKVRGVKAYKSNTTIISTAQKLKGIASMTSFMNIVIYALVVIIIVLAFKIRFNERNKEFGVLRTLGASTAKIKEIIIKEVIAFSIMSGVLGTVIAVGFISIITRYVEGILEISMEIPNIITLLSVGIIGVLVTLLIILTSINNIANKVCYEDAGILVKFE